MEIPPNTVHNWDDPQKNCNPIQRTLGGFSRLPEPTGFSRWWFSYVSKKILTITNDTYITATEVCAMLRQIASEYKGLPVHLVLDNARYQKCTAVEELAGKLGISLEYIPPYSPNLNLMERIWKFVKGELRSKYYGDFESFQVKIDSTINSISGSNKPKIDKLIGRGVQLYQDLKAVDGNTFSCPERIKDTA